VHHLDKKEADNAGRSALRWPVFAFVWTDGNPVHVLLTDDGSHQ
jgi:hypothetical protein